MIDLEPHTQELTDVFVLTKQFSNANEFSIFIETKAMQDGETLMDTIIAYCEENDIDLEVAAKLVSKSLKEKIRVEAEDRNMMRRDEGRLTF